MDVISHLPGWSSGAMVLGKIPVPVRPTVWMIVGQGPIALAVCSGGCFFFFNFLYLVFPLSPSLWETARYRLKFCLKGSLNPKQPTIHRVYQSQKDKQQVARRLITVFCRKFDFAMSNSAASTLNQSGNSEDTTSKTWVINIFVF